MSDMERELVSFPSLGAGLYAICLASAWFPFQKSAVSCGACTSSAAFQVSCASEYPVHLTRYWSHLDRPKRLAPMICSTSHSGSPSMTSGGGAWHGRHRGSSIAAECAADRPRVRVFWLSQRVRISLG